MAEVDSGEASRMPSQTVYLSNLNEKVRKEELRLCLYALCSQFGPILDIVSTRSVKMRGQAFVVFKSIASASSAVQKLAGFPFFDKQMKVQYAEAKSDIVARLDGTYSVEMKKHQKEDKAARKASKAAAAQNPKKRRATEEVEGEPTAKRPTLESVELNPRSPILFIQQVPREATTEEISSLFSKFAGFKELKRPKPELAFAFYDSDSSSAAALQACQGHQFGAGHDGLLVNFAKN